MHGAGEAGAGVKLPLHKLHTHTHMNMNTNKRDYAQLFIHVVQVGHLATMIRHMFHTHWSRCILNASSVAEHDECEREH